MENFDFEISRGTKQAVVDMGYSQPTPIQELTIPPLLKGRDVIGQAQTGTGKTAAFGIPMIDLVDETSPAVQALVLCPTRELAVQTAGELTKLAKYKPRVSTLAVYGGQPIERQLRALKAGVQIVVGTPGRVMDHMNRGTLKLENVRFLVLDEADEMLDMGFRDDIESILTQVNPDRQTALFSATMPLPIMSLSKKYLREPEYLRVENKAMMVEAVKQSYIPVRSFHKPELLSRILVRDGITRALVFINTKLGVEEVVTKLQSRGFSAAGLHGDMRQIERDAIMERFKNGMVNILVATDVAARGLDIDNVEAVFNYDLPLDVEYYVHRVGRTGRAGREGRAYTFVVGRETARMWEYRRVTKAAILCEQPPSGEDIHGAQQERLLERATESAAGELDRAVLDSAQKLLENAPAERVVAALLNMLNETSGDKIDPALDIRVPEPPKPVQTAVKPFGKYPTPPARRTDDRHFGGRADSQGVRPRMAYQKDNEKAPRPKWKSDRFAPKPKFDAYDSHRAGGKGEVKRKKP